MKKSLLGLLLAVAVVVPSFAQGWFLGGTLGFDSTSTKGQYDQQEFTIAPEIGCNVSDKWDVGIDFGYTYLKNPSIALSRGYDGDVKGQAVGGQFFVRYAVCSIGNFSILAKAGVGYTNTKLCDFKYSPEDTEDYTVNSYGIEIVPVVQYKINDKWSIVANLNFLSFGYSHNSGVGSCPDSDKFAFNVNNAELANIGFQYRF